MSYQANRLISSEREHLMLEFFREVNAGRIGRVAALSKALQDFASTQKVSNTSASKHTEHVQRGRGAMGALQNIRFRKIGRRYRSQLIFMNQTAPWILQAPNPRR